MLWEVAANNNSKGHRTQLDSALKTKLLIRNISGIYEWGFLSSCWANQDTGGKHLVQGHLEVQEWHL